MTLLLTLSLLGCSPEPATVPAASAAAVAPTLQTGEVKAVAHRREVELTGSLEPAAAVQLGFDVPGRIDKLLVTRGQSVRAGQPVARLDSRMAAAQLAQAEAALAGAEAQLAGGESGYARAEKLHTAGAMSDQQFSDAQASIRAARAGIEQARAAVQLARTNFDNHTLKAPIAGVVTNAPDNAGTLVGAGTPMFMIEDLSALQLKATAPESAGWLQEGMSATATAGPPGSEVGQPATVTRVIPSLDPMTRRIPVEIRVDDAGSLKAHAFARVTVRDTADVAALEVPRAALIARPDFCVFVDEGAGKPRRVPVSVLDENPTTVVVQGELAAGAKVILNPPPTLVEG